MVYADTCLLVSLFLRDAGTEAALAWLTELDGQPIMVSHWSLTEFSSAAASLARQKVISDKLHAAAQQRFRSFAAQRFTIEAPLPADFEQAAAMVEHHATGLRAGDALHLAVCARKDATLCSADKLMMKAAKNFSIKARSV